MRVVLTAGFDRAPNTLAVAEMLRRRGDEVCGVVVVSAFNRDRLQRLIRQRGIRFIAQALRRLSGFDRKSARPENPLGALFVQYALTAESLKSWCRRHGVEYLNVKSLNQPSTVEWLRQNRPDLVIYGGGGILRKPFIEASGRRVLNAHSGPLPQVRGMNACEWSLLLDHEPTVTIHYIDEGVDTGDVLRVYPVPLETGDDIERMRDKCVVAGVTGLIETVALLDKLEPLHVSDGNAHRQCYVMAPVMREILDARLAADTTG